MKKLKYKIGDKFNRLTILSIYFKKKINKKGIKTTEQFSKCRCDCGTIKEIRTHGVVGGRTKSCGCMKQDKARSLVGRKIGHLKIIKLDEGKLSPDKNLMVVCQCDCGAIKSMNSRAIIRGGSLSCGCKYNRWNKFEKISVDYWSRTQRSAEKRNLKFEITPEYAWDILEKQNFKCAYTGKELNFSRTRKERTASMDRIDSAKGYIEGNIQWVFRPINFMKSRYKEEDFLSYVKLIYEFKNLGENNEKTEDR